MKKYRSYVLPAAILLGILLHRACAFFAPVTPYFIFIILLLNFSAVDVKKLRFSKLSACIMLVQMIASILFYILFSQLFHNELLAQGMLIGILCPVASSVVVISCILGAKRETVTEYTIIGNLMVSITAPLYFTFIGVHPDLSFWPSFLLILKKIGPTIALPCIVALILQTWFKKTNDFLCRFTDYTFYIWAFLLLLTLGKTIDFIFIHGKGNLVNILLLGLCSALTCAASFRIGKRIGKRNGDTMAGGQLLGQKNTAMGIWMANTFLNPLASVFLAFYAVWQNLFNSWQMWKQDN